MNPQTYQIIALRAGLRLYAKTGMKPNTLWTPTRMMKLAEHFTGQQFKRRDYLGAAAALDKLTETPIASP